MLKNWRVYLIVLLALYACLSIVIGVHNALGPAGSQDFQYSGARLLLAGENAYERWASDRDLFLLSQAPNYLPLIFFLLSPLGALDWGAAKFLWAALNVCFTLGIAAALFMGQARAGKAFALMAALIFISSSEVRNTIGNGQHGLLVTLAIIGSLRLVSSSALAGALLSIAVTKYSLGAFYAAGFVGRQDRAPLIWASAITLVSFLAFWSLTQSHASIEGLFAPIQVSKTATSMLQPFSGLSAMFGHYSVVALALAGMILVALLSFRARAPTAAGEIPEVGCLATRATFAALAFAPHLTYDYVLLAVPFVFGLSFQRLPLLLKIALGGLVAFHWVGRKILTIALPIVAPATQSQILGFADLLGWSLVVLVFLRFAFEPSRGMAKLFIGPAHDTAKKASAPA